MIPGFEDQLIGLDINNETKVKVKFPKNYQKTDFSDKEAVFEVKVKDILEAQKAQINEDLAKKMGLPDLKTLRDAVKSQIEMNYKTTSRKNINKKLQSALNDIRYGKGVSNAKFLTADGNVSIGATKPDKKIYGISRSLSIALALSVQKQIIDKFQWSKNLTKNARKIAKSPKHTDENLGAQNAEG